MRQSFLVVLCSLLYFLVLSILKAGQGFRPKKKPNVVTITPTSTSETKTSGKESELAGNVKAGQASKEKKQSKQLNHKDAKDTTKGQPEAKETVKESPKAKDVKKAPAQTRGTTKDAPKAKETTDGKPKPEEKVFVIYRSLLIFIYNSTGCIKKVIEL